MANEIVEITRHRLEGRLAVRVIFLYGPIDPVTLHDDTPIPLTPSNTLDGLALQYDFLGTAEKNALDNGTGFFIEKHYEQADGESIEELEARIQGQYMIEGGVFLNAAREQYANAGRRHDAVVT